MTAQLPNPIEIHPGRASVLGAVFDGSGTYFGVFSENAQQIYVCLFEPEADTETHRLALPARRGPIWHGYVPGLMPGSLYGLRADGPFAPEQGHRFNVNKLLIDPYARAFSDAFNHHPATYGYVNGQDDLSFDTQDSAPFMPRCVVPGASFADHEPQSADWDGAFIYETHVKGMTKRHPDVPPALRGTFEGLATDAVISHLKGLGVTAIELLPVQAIHSEQALHKRGLVNYWGYNTIGFFAPEPRYFGPNGAAGFRAMVDRLHAAGIEVILDVVYNHTAESDHLGPTLCFRGLDNASYYRLQAADPRYYVNDTGTGNALDLAHPFVMRLVMDSMRFWVREMGVDGFRFDLGVALGREADGFSANSGFLRAMRQDPVLGRVKLIAEPWDIGPGGYQVGQFPTDFAEWNDQYRNTVRRFWRGDAHSAQDLGAALLGSASLFDHNGREAWASVNHLAAHDGYTLADVTRYEQRHNHANGEDNRDGHHANFSDNFGVEGDGDDPDITAARAQRARNMLATLFLSQGTPMLLAGDELGHSQRGNNNAYAQDNDTTWLDWTARDERLAAFTARLSQFRRDHPVLRQVQFLHGDLRAEDGMADAQWFAPDGGAVDWEDADLGGLCLMLRGSAKAQHPNLQPVFLGINRTDTAIPLCLPPGVWSRAIDTADPMAQATQHNGSTEMAPHSMAAFSRASGQ